MRPAILIYNPVSGSQVEGKQIPRLLETLRTGGFDARPMPTAGPGDATSLARAGAETGDIDVAFALGGDGTLREVAAGLLGTEVALGALPAGTANVLAFELGLPRRPARAAKALAGAETRLLDVGLAAGEIPFLMMASGGLDAKVMSNQNSAMKRRFGPAAVAASGVRQFWAWHSPPIDLRVDGEEERVTFFSVCNIPFFGGPFKLAPDADSQDGHLDLVTFTTPGRLPIMGLLRDLLVGRHVRRRDVRIRRFEDLEVLGPLPWGLQVDGDVLPVDLPCRITVRRQALKVLVPAKR